MLQITVIGNIGADAKVINENGRSFVSFNVGHNDKYTDQSGNEHSETQWVSCALNGDGGALLPYLTKGKMVFVQGRGRTRMYSSPKDRKMVAGLNLSVDRIELLGGGSDPVPRKLATPDGVLHEVEKYYYLGKEAAKAAGATKTEIGLVYAENGTAYQIDNGGWVRPCVMPSNSNDNQKADAVQQ